MAQLQLPGRGLKRKLFQTVESGKNKQLPTPKKRTIQTIESEKSKSSEKPNEIFKKLEGCPELLIEKFEELFNQSIELSDECSKFSKKDMSGSFPELESEAIELVKKKDEVSISVELLFEEYLNQKLSKRNPNALAFKNESKLIIEQSQKCINDCRALMDEVRQKRQTTLP